MEDLPSSEVLILRSETNDPVRELSVSFPSEVSQISELFERRRKDLDRSVANGWLGEEGKKQRLQVDKEEALQQLADVEKRAAAVADRVQKTIRSAREQAMAREGQTAAEIQQQRAWDRIVRVLDGVETPEGTGRAAALVERVQAVIDEAERTVDISAMNALASELRGYLAGRGVVDPTTVALVERVETHPLVPGIDRAIRGIAADVRRAQESLRVDIETARLDVEGLLTPARQISQYYKSSELQKT